MGSVGCTSNRSALIDWIRMVIGCWGLNDGGGHFVNRRTPTAVRRVTLMTRNTLGVKRCAAFQCAPNMRMRNVRDVRQAVKSKGHLNEFCGLPCGRCMHVVLLIFYCMLLPACMHVYFSYLTASCGLPWGSVCMLYFSYSTACCGMHACLSTPRVLLHVNVKCMYTLSSFK